VGGQAQEGSKQVGVSAAVPFLRITAPGRLEGEGQMAEDGGLLGE
jgi:hypothetical protein